jgi:hypothetical protein
MSKMSRQPYKKKELNENPSDKMDEMVNIFWHNNLNRDNRKINELEVRFATRSKELGVKPLTKIDYDKVIHKLKSLGFTCLNEQGKYMLRIQNNFLDPKSGKYKLSYTIRTEINGFENIKDYCSHNDIKKLMAVNEMNVGFYIKDSYIKDGQKLYPVNFNDFNFRVSYQTEEQLKKNSGIVLGVIDKWDKSLKNFRYINRVTFTHPDFPIQVDLSIVKSSSFDVEKREVNLAYTTEDSGVFNNQEMYEIELEVINSKIGEKSIYSGSPIITTSAEELLVAMRKTIKYVLMGLQDTNYPVSYVEQKDVSQSYMKMIMGKEFNPENKHAVFIGPSPVTLQIENIIENNSNTDIINIRTNYTVSDKADGERHMMYISPIGKIYLISSNMKIIFTGSITKTKEIFNSLLDGEFIQHDKLGNFINLYATFDIYFNNNVDVRSYGFIPRTEKDARHQFRLPILKHLIRSLKYESIVKGDSTPINIIAKRFYTTNISENELSSVSSSMSSNIFSACDLILKDEKAGLFNYNLDGLIFTPASMGVGANKIGETGPLKRITWDYAFKWKPPLYNTIDFLIETVKTSSGVDLVTPIFQDGMNTSSMSQFTEYKTIKLCCGWDESKDGYLNPCQYIIEDKIPEIKRAYNAKLYKPAQFVPTNPSAPDTGICNIIMKNGHMVSENEEVFGDSDIVEFRYNLTEKNGWKWIPLRVRYDKIAKRKQGLPEYGNSYTTANSNWYSINNPITIDMISTGNGIIENIEVVDDDIYYSNSASNETLGLRDFHNKYVKKQLITAVSRRGDTLIDYACGKAGDLPKWIDSQLSFVFGIDISKDNLENRIDGACARFLNSQKIIKNMPKCLFVNGNSSLNIRNGSAMLNDKAIQITKAVFGEGSKDEEKLGKGVYKQYGKGIDGFNISSCQFAQHYFFENKTTFQNFVKNVSECTKVGGYYVGTCYDGKMIFNMLKDKKRGENVELYNNTVKIWEIVKDYDTDVFEDDISSIGHKIMVYQESIGSLIPEYLVNLNYLTRVMEDCGFVLITREEAKIIGMPDGSGSFGELFNMMMAEIKRNRNERIYRFASEMKEYEKTISFYNKYFIYKKVRNVNSKKISLDVLDEELNEEKDQQMEQLNRGVEMEEVQIVSSEKEKEKKRTKPRVKKLHNKLIIIAATDSDLEKKSSAIEEPLKGDFVIEPEIEIEIEQEEQKQEEEPEIAIKEVVKKVKKVKLPTDESKKPKSKPKLKIINKDIIIEEPQEITENDIPPEVLKIIKVKKVKPKESKKPK